MACSYCGKEIGPFRLLRDREFCSSAHRKGYRARLGKVLHQISADQPPPAAVAGFIPYKPFPGNNLRPIPIWTLDSSEQDVQLPRAWPVFLVPMPRESVAPVALPKPASRGAADASGGSRAQPWRLATAIHLPALRLSAENPLAGIAEWAEEDPPPAGPLCLDAPAANFAARPQAGFDPTRTPVPVRLSHATPEIAFVRPLAICDAATGLSPEVVEAFLPPAPEPQIIPYVAAATLLPQLTINAVEYMVAAALSESAPSLAAQVVESFLPAPPEPRTVPYVAAVTLLPQLTINVVEYVVAAALSESAPSPPAQVVESFLPPAPEPRMVPYAPRASVLPHLSINPVELLVSTATAEAVMAPAPQAVESFLPPAPEPLIVPYTATATALPQLTLSASEWVISTDTAEAVMAPAAQVVESLLPPAPEPLIVPYAATAMVLPQFTLNATEWVVSTVVAEAATAPAAQAVESLLPPAPEPLIVPYMVTATVLPRLTLNAIEWVVAAVSAEAATAPAAQAVESFLPQAAALSPLPQAIPAPRLQSWTLAAAEPDPFQEPADEVIVAPASEYWMVSPPAAEVVREVIPSLAGALPMVAAIQEPGVATFAMEQPMIRWAGDWRASPSAEPVFSYVTPSLEESFPSTLALCLPDVSWLRAREHTRSGNRAAYLAAPADEDYPRAVEPPETALPVAIVQSPEEGADRWARLIQFPRFTLEQPAGKRAAEFRLADMPAAEPREAARHAGPVNPESAPTLHVQAPASPPQAALIFGLPQPGPVPLEFFCQRAAMAPVLCVEWKAPPRSIHPPKLTLRALFDRTAEEVTPPKPVRQPPAFAEIFAITRAARRSTGRNSLGSVGKMIAASLLVGIGLWFGAGSVKIGKQMVAINTSLPSVDVPGGSSSGFNSSAPRSASGFPAVRYAAPQSPQGPVAMVRRAIRQRAAVELTDTFRRMEEWGAAAKALPAGWSRHPDGYVHTGQLALYHPSQTFADYRFEFFGEIEKKSMSWAVRARDAQNYYAMKFTVVEPGLRPVIAAVHYPVVGGKKGQRVETPLSVMVHNHEPYHVEVNVKGNRVITSIEGQEVDSWTDDTLKIGGIGFFSDVGESARLYWIRVTKNQDWLGRVCAYLSNGSGTDTAELWSGDIPTAPSQPSRPALPPDTDVTLAAAEIEEFSHMGPQRARTLNYGRTELCRS